MNTIPEGVPATEWELLQEPRSWNFSSLGLNKELRYSPVPATAIDDFLGQKIYQVGALTIHGLEVAWVLAVTDSAVSKGIGSDATQKMTSVMVRAEDSHPLNVRPQQAPNVTALLGKMPAFCINVVQQLQQLHPVFQPVQMKA